MKSRASPASLFVSMVALALLAALALSGCASSLGSTYRPKGGGRIGYSDEQLAPNRFRVSFAGPAGGKLVDVEDLLLRRAAEITIRAGYTHFVFERKRTEANVSGHRAGENWNPDHGLLFDCGPNGPRNESTIDQVSQGFCPSTPIIQYTATSEIVVMKPEEASRNPLALAAREILARLAPSELSGEMAAS